MSYKGIHSCSYYCDNPACIKAQRDELRTRLLHRAWQGLTDGEIEKINSNCTDWGAFEYERTIEQALKEKNFG
jgi:hypothetical protein